MMPENVITKKETALEKDLITKVGLAFVLVWAFGFAWGVIMTS
jgi:hypothetical protein